MNGGDWYRLEGMARNLLIDYDDVFVVSGPLWLPDPTLHDADGNPIVAYSVIGENQVAAPTHMFKAILAETAGGENRATAAYVMPNRPIDAQLPLAAYQVPLEEVDRRGGIQLFPAVDRTEMADLGSLPSALYGSNDRAEQWRRFGQLKTAASQKQLDASWVAAQAGLEGEPTWVTEM